MTDTLEKPVGQVPDDDHFTLDRRYLKGQVSEAIALFLAPMAGVFTAAAGTTFRMGMTPRRRAKGRKKVA